MKTAKIQFTNWDKPYFFTFEDLNLKVDDMVVVNTEMGTELGKVVGFSDVNEKKFYKVQGDKKTKLTLKPIDRVARREDLENVMSEEEKEEALRYASQVKNRFNLEMKMVDVQKSIDGSKMSFAFVADGRVDFREMVKDMIRHFNATIRLQQIGIRDEAKLSGDCGGCGKPLCCKSHLTELTSVTSDMADVQQCGHRGSDRISGICGRLMCCLAYEEKGYAELTKKMPPIGAKVNVDGARGVVISQNPLKQAVNVKFTDKTGRYTITEVDLNRNKKK